MKHNRLVKIGFFIVMYSLCLLTFAQAQWTFNGNNIYNTNWATYGRIGIGTYTPGQTLEVFTGNSTLGIRINRYASGVYYSDIIHTASPEGLAFNVGNGSSISEKMRITGDGNVGIGTTSPLYGLHLFSTNTAWQTSRLFVEGPNWPGLSMKQGTAPIASVVTKGNGEIAFWSNQENMIITSGGNVGIGTASPVYKLDVNGAINATSVLVNGVAVGAGGTQWANVSGGAISYNSGNVGIGTTNPGTYKLAVNGTVRVKEIVASTQGWPDFVFDKNYQPVQLSDLEKFIKTNKHLPGFPSAQEVKTHGVQLGEMQAKLLQKVEELTLYVIELKKDNESLKKELSDLEKQK